MSRSSAESKLRSLAHGVCEGIWLKKLLEDLKVKIDGPVKMLCDNKSAISIARDPVQHDRTKHVEIDHHFLSEKIEEKVISLLYVNSINQAADVFTKPLPRQPFIDNCSKLALIDIHQRA